MSTFVALHNQLHKTIRVDSKKVEAQSASESMVPVVIHEFLKLVVQYPIVFTKSSDTGQFVCVALLGFEKTENLFWDGQEWQGIYTPLNVKRQPFFIGQEQGQTIICIDTESESISADEGEAIFNDQGEETEYLRTIQAMLSQLIDGEVKTQDFIQTLLDHKLIMPLSFDITFVNRQEQRVQGLYTIDEKQLELLNEQALKALHEKKFLKPLYLMIASLSHIYALVQKKNERLSH